MGRIFDILGWLAPAIVVINILLQKLWKIKLGWGVTLPPNLLTIWEKWKDGVSLIMIHLVPR